jgi:hypothetical protein
VTARDLRWAAAGFVATALLILASATPALLSALASPLARL